MLTKRHRCLNYQTKYTCLSTVVCAAEYKYFKHTTKFKRRRFNSWGLLHAQNGNQNARTIGAVESIQQSIGRALCDFTGVLRGRVIDNTLYFTMSRKIYSITTTMNGILCIMTYNGATGGRGIR